MRPGGAGWQGLSYPFLPGTAPEPSVGIAISRT